MKKPDTPTYEGKRLQALCSLNILDTPAEERFDRFTRIAKRHFDVSIALVSLIDSERQWFKSKQGLDASETPRDISFCGHAILQNGIFNIPNALEDPRFADNPLVSGPPNIRFYAGAPLHAPNGQAIGTLCIIDDKPRSFTAEELTILRDLANGVEEELARSKRALTRNKFRIHPISTFSLIVGGLLSSLLFLMTFQAKENQIDLQLQSLAVERSAALTAELETIEDIMHGVAGLYAVSTHVNPQDFEIFLKTAFPNKEDVRAVAWIENLDKNELQAFSQQAFEDGYYDFQLKELGANNQLVNVAPQENNQVVYHSYSQLNEHWLSPGLDLSRSPEYKALFERAASSGKLVAKLRSGSFEQSSRNIELFLPVFHTHSPAQKGLADTKELLGFVGLLLSVGETLETAFRSRVAEASGLNTYIVSAEPGQQSEILYFHPSRTRASTADALPLQELEQAKSVNHDIDYADIHWQMVLRPIAGQFDASNDPVPWVTFGAGLLFSLMIAGYLNSQQRRRAIIEQEVQLRTEELNNSRERVRAVIDTVVDGIVTIDAQEIVHSFNPAAEKIFGYRADEVIDHNVNILMPDPYAKAHDGYLHNYLTTGDKKVIGIGREVTGKRKDGSTFPMELAVSEMRINEERMFTGIVRDITERKKMEQVKSEFISTVSHELRTPLTSIRGALGLVLGKAADQLPAKMLKMLEMANRNSERLTLLINDILDLEKIESGRLEFEFKSVDLVDLAHQAATDNEGYASQHQVKLALETELNEAPVTGDSHRLLQVFANLISNAVKYSPINDTVNISLTSHEAGFRIAVRDNGSGIPKKFRSRIFQRFAQADSSDTREKGGTGLGLSITKAIVERHDGRINYESEPGKGTVFYFDLPRAQQAIRKGSKTSTDTRVLICEDNADVAEILAQMLKSANMEADIAASADAARSLLAKHSYRLMLLDLNLPDIDGLQFLKELRTIPATMELPIIVVSGRASEGRAEFTGDAVMVVDWIQKPVDRDQLERALKDAMHRTVRPRILHVEDDPDILQVTQMLLDDMADITHVATVKGCRELLAAEEFDLVILDLGLEDGSGVELLDKLKGRYPVIIFSAQVPGREITAQVTAALTKSITSNEQLLATIQDALKG